MKQFKFMSFLLTFLSVSFVFVACKQQDKSQMLVGEWKYKNTITAQHEVWEKPNETITHEKSIKFDGDGKVLYRHKSTSQYVLGHTNMRPSEMLWKNKVHIKSKIMILRLYLTTIP